MRVHRNEFEPLRGVLSDADEPLTAREILASLDEHERAEFESSHRVATVLGRHANRGEVEVVRSRSTPYRYRLDANA